MNEFRYFKDSNRSNDGYKIVNDVAIPNKYLNSKIDIFNAETGERIFEPLHNRTTIAGAALTAMKLFNLDRNVLDNTPTYDTMLTLDNGANGSTYPSINITDNDGKIIGQHIDETQRIICGFCVGTGGAGLDISDVYDVNYCDYISPDNLVPFRYPLQSADTVDESMYKGKKALTLNNGQQRNAYYFKAFSNSPNLVQCLTSTVGTFTDNISASTVYSNNIGNGAQSYVELHLKITKEDCRDFFIAHTGLENSKINQISLVSAWSKTVSVTKLDSKGNNVTKDYEYFQDIRPFSLLNIPNEILSDLDKSISIIYTLYF